MTQIVLNVEDNRMLSSLRKILGNLNGVSIAKIAKDTRTRKKERGGTLTRAIEEVRNGELIRVNSIAELMSELES